MTMKPADLYSLRASLAVAVAAVAVGAAIVWWSGLVRDGAAKSAATARSEQRGIEDKLRQVRTEEHSVRRKAETFAALTARGVIGDEQRLDWVDLIREIRQSHKLLEINYEFSPQQPLEMPPAEAYSFRRSVMKLRMKLLHEGDLLDFLHDLGSRAKALVRVRSCNVVRTPRDGKGRGGIAQLDADCEIEWITVALTPGKP